MSTDEKIIDKIRKLIAIAEGSTNSAEMANEAITAGEMAQGLLEKYKLDISFLSKEEQRVAYIEIGNNLGKSIVENPIKRANAVSVKSRTIWFEKLAKVVGETYFCKVGFLRRSGAVSFYGYDLDREIAAFMLVKLAVSANEIAKDEGRKLKEAINKQGISKGISAFSKKVVSLPRIYDEDEFTSAFHAGFRKSVEEKYNSHRNPDLKNEDVEVYYNSAATNEKENEYYHHFLETEWKDQYVFDLGYKFALKLSSKSSAIVNKKTSTSLVGTKVKVVFVGNAFLLIDTSGSMNGGRLEEAKSGAIQTTYINCRINRKWKVYI